MKYLKLFEDFKVKNITQEDVIACIQKRGKIYATIVKDFPGNDPKEPLNPLSVDEDGLVTVDYDGSEYEVNLNDIERIEL